MIQYLGQLLSESESVHEICSMVQRCVYQLL